MEGDRVDFFVSHASEDRAWAEWVAWQLMDAGYSVELDVWDWTAGQNFLTAMSDALARADRVVALFSVAYFERERYTTAEWSASLVQVPGVMERRLVPVRVEEVAAELVPPVLRSLVYCDVFGMSEEAARQALLTAVAGTGRPSRQPRFPGPAVHGLLDQDEALEGIPGYRALVRDSTDRITPNIHPALPLPADAPAGLSDEFSAYLYCNPPGQPGPVTRLWRYQGGTLHPVTTVPGDSLAVSLMT